MSERKSFREILEASEKKVDQEHMERTINVLFKSIGIAFVSLFLIALLMYNC